MRLLQLLAASLIPASTLAVFADEAFQVDYHHALLGIPQEENTFVYAPVAASKASLIYTLTEKSLFGAVNPKDGTIVWRQQLHGTSNSSNAVLRAGGENVVATGAGSQVSAWQASDGRMIWSHEYGAETTVKDVRFLELKEDGTTAGSKDVLVLFQGTTSGVERRDVDSGEVKWQYVDASGDSLYRLGLTGTTIHLVSLHGALLGGQKLRVTDIDAVTGQKTDQQTMSDGDVASEDDVLFVGAGTASPIVAWTDKSFKAIKVNLLGTKTVVSLSVDKKGEELENIKILAPGGLSALPHFLVQYTSTESHWAEVYHIDLAKSTIKREYSLPKIGGKGAFAVSTSDANVFFTRIARGAITVTSSASHGILERKAIKEFVPTSHGTVEPLSAVAEVMARPDGSPAAVRASVLLSSGDWVMYLNGELAWARPEVLTLATSVVFTEPAQGERLAAELAIEEHASIPQAFTHRLFRHIEELKTLPEWLQRQPAKIKDSLIGASLARKGAKFGFNKLVVAATSNGRLVAIDTGTGGQVAWNQPIKNFAPADELQTVLASSPGRVHLKTGTDEAIYNLEGQFLRKAAAPSDETASSAISYEVSNSELKGYAGADKKSSIWTFKPKTGERILSVTSRPTEDPVAQIGVVLGDRRVLYKYLNPNLALIVTANDAAGSISASLIDSVSGNVLYEAKHAGVDASRPIAAALSENWLSYSFSLRSGPITPSRGHVLVTAHLLESAVPNERGPLGSASNYSSFDPLTADAGKPYVISSSFQIPEEISSLSVSHTKQGITSRMLIAVLPAAASIVGIPVQFLDPRRPVGRAPTSQEQMEGLTQYQPVLDFNPQWVLNHKREVLGVEKVITNPAVLESTSLVFAYGGDVFGTRVSPSFAFDVLGRGFNKVQMLLTVAALFVAVVFVAPLVKRKQINMRWSV